MPRLPLTQPLAVLLKSARRSSTLSPEKSSIFLTQPDRKLSILS
jgi:hypothetical protein